MLGLFSIFLFFFFKQKTAYDVRLSLVGSEMCIRDRFQGGQLLVANQGWGAWGEALSDLRGGDPEYSQLPLPIFSAVKGDKPVLSKGAPASIFSFLKKNDD